MLAGRYPMYLTRTLNKKMPRRVNLVPVDPRSEPVGSRWNPIDLTSEPEPELECHEELELRTPPRLPRILGYRSPNEAWVAAYLELNQARAEALDRRIRRRLF